MVWGSEQYRPISLMVFGPQSTRNCCYEPATHALEFLRHRRTSSLPFCQISVPGLCLPMIATRAIVDDMPSALGFSVKLSRANISSTGIQARCSSGPEIERIVPAQRGRQTPKGAALRHPLHYLTKEY